MKKQKKDQFIEEQLDQLLDQPAPLHLLNDALEEMRRIKRARQRQRNRRFIFWVLAPLVPLILVAIVVSNLPGRTLGGKMTTTSSSASISQVGNNTSAIGGSRYDDSQLMMARKTSAQVEAIGASIGGPLFPDLALGPNSFTPEYFLYSLKDSSLPVFLTMNTRMAAGTEIQEVFIGVELTQYRYSKYAGFDDHPELKVNNTPVSSAYYLVAGEYQEEATFYAHSLKYYVIVLSPSNGQITSYVRSVLNLVWTN